MSSSDSEDDYDLEYLEAESIEKEGTGRSGKRVIWANGFSYTHNADSRKREVSELKRWIIIFSKLAYLPVSDVLIGYDALVKEHERLMECGVVDAREQSKVDAFLKYVRQTFLYRGTIDDVRPSLYDIELWNVNEHLLRQWPVTNNAVESWNKEYNAHFPGGGKPDRSKVIRHQMDEEKSVRHAILRHQLKPEEEFRIIRPMQRQSEERIHALVSEWREKSAAAFPSDGALLGHLQSIQDALWYAKGNDPDVDEIQEDENDEVKNENSRNIHFIKRESSLSRCRSYERICLCGTNWGAMSDRLNAVTTTAPTPKYENKTSYFNLSVNKHPVINYHKSYSSSKGCGNKKNIYVARSTIPALPSLHAKHSTLSTENMDGSKSINNHNLLCNADAGQISLFMNNLGSDFGSSCAFTDSSISGYCESLYSGFSETSTLKCEPHSSAFGCQQSGLSEPSTSSCYESSNDNSTSVCHDSSTAYADTSTSSCYESSTACADSSTSCCDSSASAGCDSSYY
uniref:Uncharacterized protein n=1 Tax=Ditylenchus dipsaci TaxID=166011 RepID=A0A915DWC2_9BILA